MKENEEENPEKKFFIHFQIDKELNEQTKARAKQKRNTVAGYIKGLILADIEQAEEKSKK